MKIISEAEKYDIAQRIIGVSLNHITFLGDSRTVESESFVGKIQVVSIQDSLTIVHRTPLLMLGLTEDEEKEEQGHDYCIDIWLKDVGTVFSAYWSPFRVIVFKKGAWIDQLLGTGNRTHVPIFPNDFISPL